MKRLVIMLSMVAAILVALSATSVAYAKPQFPKKYYYFVQNNRQKVVLADGTIVRFNSTQPYVFKKSLALNPYLSFSATNGTISITNAELEYWSRALGISKARLKADIAAGASIYDIARSAGYKNQQIDDLFYDNSRGVVYETADGDFIYIPSGKFKAGKNYYLRKYALDPYLYDTNR